MAKLFRMPGVSADADEATVIEWNVAAGERVGAGQTVAVVETEKATVDIEADEDAIVFRLLAEAGEPVPVGDPIAIFARVDENIDDETAVLTAVGLAPAEADTPVETLATEATTTETIATETPVGEASAETTATEGPATQDAATAPVPAPAGRIFASPLARRLAKQHQLEVEQIRGTGPNGRIVRDDVERAAADHAAAAAPTASAPVPAAPPAPAVELAAAIPAAIDSAAQAPTAETAGAASAPSAGSSAPSGGADIPHTALRKLIASRLQSSKRDAPHFYLTKTVRVDELLALRTRVNEKLDSRVSINDFMVAAVARSIALVPEINVEWTETALHRHSAVDIAVAIASDRGLVTPVVRGADRLSLSELSATIKDYVARAGEGRLKQQELEGGSFTVSNLGMFGIDSFSAIINPPQAGILAVGAVTRQPIVVDDELVIGSTVSVTASIDHRAVDGALGARWLKQFAELVEDPFRLLI